MTGLMERLTESLRNALSAALDRVLLVGEITAEDADKIGEVRNAILSEATGDLADVAAKTLAIPVGTRRVLCQLESDGIQFKKANIEARIICQDTEANILDLRVMRGQWVEICATQLEIPETLGGGGQMTLEDLGEPEIEITVIKPPEEIPGKKERKRRAKKAETTEPATADADAEEEALPPVQFSGTAEVRTAPDDAEDASEIDQLTEQQDTALTMMIEGKTNEEIAEALNVPPRMIARWKKIPVISNALIAVK